jgi:hypothetical protein
MRKLGIFLNIIIIAIFFGTFANAKNLKFNSSSVVLVQELDIMSVWLCPVSDTNQFETHCRNRDGFYFHLAAGKRDIITLENGGLYGVKAVKGKHIGRFAFALGRVQSGSVITTYRVKDQTMVANVKPGTVLIMPHSYGLSKSQLNKTLKRIKSIFKKRYGSIADQMTYKIMETKKISCTKSNAGQACNFR